MNLIQCIAVVVLTSGIAVGVLALVRRRSPHGGHFTDTSRAGSVFTILATFFAVLFAFVVLFAFGAYQAAGSNSELEAETVLQQFETAQLLDTEHSAAMGAQLRCYALSVIHDEWPAMRAGQRVGLNEWDTELFVTLQGIDPQTAAQQAAYGQWLDQRSTREEARQQRELGEEGVIPLPVWFVLLLTAAIVWGFAFLFADRGEGMFVQCALIAAVTTMLVTGLLVVRFLDNPYSSGSGSIAPTAMQETVDQIDLLATKLDIRLPQLCDGEGRRAP